MSEETKIPRSVMYLAKVLAEKNSGFGPEPAIGDFLFDFNGDFIGFLLAKDFKNDMYYGTIQLCFDTTKERIIRKGFKNEPKEI